MLGVWVITLTVINLVSGAYSPGFKVLWIGFISGEHGTSNIAHDGVSVVLDDVVFGLLGIVLLALGSMGMSKAVEGGIAAWAGGIPQGPVQAPIPAGLRHALDGPRGGGEEEGGAGTRQRSLSAWDRLFN